jgi:hypothetical protein
MRKDTALVILVRDLTINSSLNYTRDRKNNKYKESSDGFLNVTFPKIQLYLHHSHILLFL